MVRYWQRVVLCLTAATPLSAANAAMKCVDGYQLVAGAYVSTPYCQDAQLADVARANGIKVSAAEIRENPFVKRRVCRFIGHDIRVKESCITADSGVRGRPF